MQKERLEKAVQAKSQRRQESDNRRQVARQSMDRLIENTSPDDFPRRRQQPSKVLSPRKFRKKLAIVVAKQEQKRHMGAEEKPTTQYFPQSSGAGNLPSSPKRKTSRRKIIRRVKKKPNEDEQSTSQRTSTSERKKVTLPLNQTELQKQQREQARAIAKEALMRNMSTNQSSTGTSGTTKPVFTRNTSSRATADTYSSRELSSGSNHSILYSSSDHSQPTSFNTLSNGSDHGYIDPASFRSQHPPPSWSHRNADQTGFYPNNFISKETMTQYTEALGGVKTVATTTKIFYDKAKYDPELKVFFKKTRWEHMRNEFIILANLVVPTTYDETIQGILEHHCRILENGADMQRLIDLWEASIESSWQDNGMDDARALIVGPNRVIFNLRALERHYAMYLKRQRAAERRAALIAQREAENDNSDYESSSDEDSSTPKGRSGNRRRGFLGRFRRKGHC